MAKKSSLNFMNSVQISRPNRSVHDLSHTHQLSCNMGTLVPVMVHDLVPGDKINVDTQAMIRFAPMVAPMFTPVNVTFHTWAVPYRILWPQWQDYITETKTAGVLPAHPFFIVDKDLPGNYTELMDHLGIPTPPGATPAPPGGWIDESISPFRMAAYQCVYNNFYRDENMIAETDHVLIDGDNTGNSDLTILRRRAWGSDYFMANLPFAQKGDPVSIPIGGFEDVGVKHNETLNPGQPGDTYLAIPAFHELSNTPTVETAFYGTPSDPVVEATDMLYAETSTLDATQSTLNDLRTAWSIQRYLERAARGGTRLVEWIRSMFDETLPDYTAQIPQYVGGSISPVQISEVLNTAGTVGELPQGNMAGRGIAFNNGKPGFYHAREHCVIITLMNIQPVTVYQQGLERQWSKITDPKEYLNPMFAHLGEQGTLKKELIAFAATGAETWGYLPRYSEYRTILNRVSGDFREDQDFWTMSRIFDVTTFPELNAAFIEADPTHRIFADINPVTSKMYVNVYNKLRAVRPLPKYGTPAI